MADSSLSQTERSGYVRYASLRELVGVARYEWSARKAWRSRRAALRGLWWWLVRRYACELCQDCGRPVGHEIGDTYWRADDALWLRVHGSPAGSVCTRCFVERADALGVFVHVEVVAGV